MAFFDLLIEALLSDDGSNKTIAVVPGSFKPPHKGHLAMVKKYAEMADNVVVIIGAPTKNSQRLTAAGTPITPEQAKQIFDIYIKDEGLNNVQVITAQTPSPIKAAYDFIEYELKNANVILGASLKDDDWKRWERTTKYFAEKNPSIKIIDPQSTAVNISTDDGEAVSASAFRASLDNPDVIDRFLPASVIEKGDKVKILAILAT